MAHNLAGITHHPCDTMVIDNGLHVVVINVNFEELHLWKLLAELLIDGCNCLACTHGNTAEAHQTWWCGAGSQLP